MKNPLFTSSVWFPFALISAITLISFGCKTDVTPPFECKSIDPSCCLTSENDPCKSIREFLIAHFDFLERKLDIDTVTYNGCPVFANEVITNLAEFDGSKYLINTSQGRLELKDQEVVETCPCDETLILVDTTTMDIVPEELSSRGTSKEKSNGNGVFILPPDFNINESKDIAGSYIEQNNPPEHDEDPVRVAIIDSGLSKSMSFHLTGQIVQAQSLIPNEQFDDDQTGHGDAVATIINASSEHTPALYIYRIIGNDRLGSSFKLACALKCALKENVDIVNMSLGNYINDTMIYHIIEEEFAELRENAVLIASKGNDCLETDESGNVGHYPSDYSNVLGVMGLDLDIATKNPGSSNFEFLKNPYIHDEYCLLECSNRNQSCVAPCKITNTETGDTILVGTSFAAPFATGKCINSFQNTADMGLDEFVSSLTTVTVQVPGGGSFNSKKIE